MSPNRDLNPSARTETNLPEALVVTAICFGWSIFVSLSSMMNGFRSGQFSNSGLAGIILSELVLGAIALIVLRSRQYSIGSLYPAPSAFGAAIGIVLYLLTALVCSAFEAPFASNQGPQPVENLLAEATASLPVIVPTALVNGAYEEIFLLGFLVRGLRGYGLSFALGFSLLVRVLYHLYQGPMGAVSVLGFGLVLSLFYLRTGALFPAVFAHVLADIIPLI